MALSNITHLTNEAFKEIFNGAAEGILIVDREGTIITANQAAAKMFAYDSNTLTGSKIEMLLPQRYRMDHTNHRDKFNKNPSPRRMGLGRDLMAVRKDGTEFPVEVSLSYSEANRDLLIVAFIIDITQRKNAERALVQSEEQLLVYAAELEKKVSMRTEALNKSIKELEKANEDVRLALEREKELNELKTKFVSIASHEFRTPLSTILSSASLVGQYNERKESDKVEKHVKRIKSSVNHLTGILNDFLSLGKLEEGKIEILYETINIPGFLEEVVEEVSPILKPGQETRTEISGEVREISCDPKVLRNILFNLLSNASKYSGEGKSIFVQVAFTNKGLKVNIKDQGIGIPDSEKKYLFDRFFRASNATNIQGSGLGLNIVKKYIELINGSITYMSSEKTGTTFTIEIPYQQ